MDKNKQIEEMAKICHFYDDGICHLCEELLVSCDRKCDLVILVENLYNAGYRKASDIAREIFEEIEQALDGQLLEEDEREYIAFMKSDMINKAIHRYASDKIETLMTAFDLLKKKYESEESK